MHRMSAIAARAVHLPLRRHLPRTPFRTVASSAPLSAVLAVPSAPPTPPPPPPHTRVQASIRQYTDHVLVASSRHASAWPKKVEHAAPPAEDAEERATADGATIMAHLSHAGVKSTTEAPAAIITLIDVGEQPDASTPMLDGDLLLLSLHEAPHLVRSAAPVPLASVPVSTWKPKHAPHKAPTVIVRDLSTGEIGRDTEAQPLLRRVLELRDATIEPSPPSALAALPFGEAASAAGASYHVLALVCCHAQRDERCGDRGPPLLREIRRAAAATAAASSSTAAAPSPRVHVHSFACSHVGGHEFAGNVLLYGWKQVGSAQPSSSVPSPLPVLNDWFGLVDPSLVPQLLEAYTGFLVDATSGSIADVQARRQRLLAHAMHATAAPTPASDVSCSTCAPADAEAFVPRRIGDLWRGAMGMDKPAARALLQTLPRGMP